METKNGVINGHEYVDLGLRVKWATYNFGADKPYDFRLYYAWGELRFKSDYTKDNNVTNGKDLGSIVGNPKYDVARAYWGSPWRLPTRNEMDELIDKCKWEWTNQGGHNGCKITGPNGNSIFLPAAGLYSGTSLVFAEESGRYWSGTPYYSYDTSRAYNLFFRSDFYSIRHDCKYGYTDWWYREYGCSIRPVID